MTQKHKAEETTAKHAKEREGTTMLPVSALRIPPEAESVPCHTKPMRDAMLESIREEGVKTPLSVFQDGDGYTVVDGRHRLQCAMVLNLDNVPCCVVPKPERLAEHMLESALESRRLPASGVAALVVERCPALVQRRGMRGGNQCRNSDNAPSDDSSIVAACRRYHADREMLGKVIEARQECRDDAEWQALKASLCERSIGPERVLSTLRGHQSGGVSAATGKPGRAGANYPSLAKHVPVTLGNVWKHWSDIPRDRQDESLELWLEAAKGMPRDAITKVGEAAAEWSPADRDTLARKLKDLGAKA